MIIRVPKHLEEEFLNFLDIAQSAFTDEEVAKMTYKEKKCLSFVQGLIQEPAKRFANKEEAKKAAWTFSMIAAGQLGGR